MFLTDGSISTTLRQHSVCYMVLCLSVYRFVASRCSVEKPTFIIVTKQSSHDNLKTLQSAPMKNNPLGKVIISIIVIHLVTYRRGFMSHVQQISL